MALLLSRVREALRVLRWSRREQKTALLGGACFATLPLVRQLPLGEPILAVFTWILVGLGSVAWVLTAWRLWRYSLAPPAPEVDDGGVAIKGASAFTPEDAELFSRLGRLDELKQLRSWARDASKVPVVAVMGESGVGKTSLLRAGLAFILGKGEEPLPYAYWEADPANARESFLHAVEAQLGSRDLAALPRSVIVADQLEQLDPERDADFFTLLFEHLKREPPVLVTWVLAFRREFASTWWDLLLDVPESFRHRPQMLSLQRFSVRQAKEIFATLAERADLSVRQSLAEQIVEQIAEGGRVSPVDLGITLQVLHRQPNLADDPAAFRSLGGHAGLLTSYLEMILEPHPPALREEVLRALLALIDEDEDRRRPEGRGLDELLETVQPRAPRHLALALEVLAQPAVRVLERVDGTPLRYRLVHERFIPAIRRLSGDILGVADRASRLLERRFRLWQREGESARYLLEGRELRQVLSQGRALLWGVDRQEKLAFLRRSRRRRTGRWLTTAGVVALVTVGAAWAVQNQRAHAVRKDLFEWGFPAGTYELLPRITSLATPPVTNTRWLARTERLEELHLTFATQYQPGAPERLPPSLRRLHLNVSGREAAQWPQLPDRLEHLTLTLYGIEGRFSWPPLPEGLRSLTLIGIMGLESWPPLPEGLQSLTLIGTMGVETWPELPPSLGSLTVQAATEGFGPLGATWRANWPQLPADLRALTFDLGTMSVESGALPELPVSLREFRFESWLQGGPLHVPLPPTLERLQLRFAGPLNRLRLSAPPDSLRSLTINLHPGKLSWYGWPARLRYLEIGELPDWPLPPDLRRLEVTSGRPWPELPPRLEHLVLHFAGRSDPAWPDIPASIRTLGIRLLEPTASVWEWPELPPGLQELSINLGLNDAFSWPEIPDSVVHLSLAAWGSETAVGALPSALTKLELQIPGLAALPELPRSLRHLTLDIRETELVDLSILADRPLEQLTIDHRGVELSQRLELPDTLECLAIVVHSGSRTALPALPANLHRLALDVSEDIRPSFVCEDEGADAAE